MKLYTSQQMKDCDKLAMDNLNISIKHLIVKAGDSFISQLQVLFPNITRLNIMVVCGRGNNGGDGRYIADKLLRMKCNAKSITVTEDLSEDFCIPDDTDIIIDALFGTGLHSVPKTPYSTAILKMNEYRDNNPDSKVISVDIPSGANADNGRIYYSVTPLCVRADYTLTFQVPKVGMYITPASNFTGEVITVDIGMGEFCPKDTDYILIDKEFEQQNTKKRARDSNKGDFGRLSIIGGSRGMTGAVCLATRGALRNGAGLVCTIVPSCIWDVVAIKLDEATTFGAECNNKGTFAFNATDLVLESAEKSNAILLGCGMNSNEDIQRFVYNIIEKALAPLIIDADGLNAISHNVDILKSCQHMPIITPHPAEMARLCNVTTAEIQDNRLKFAQDFAKEYRCIVLLKGANSIVATPNGKVYINSSGNPSLAKGGTGDVLAGMIGALLSNGYTPEIAAALGAFRHGEKADLNMKKMKDYEMIASDLID